MEAGDAHEGMRQKQGQHADLLSLLCPSPSLIATASHIQEQELLCICLCEIADLPEREVGGGGAGAIVDGGSKSQQDTMDQNRSEFDWSQEE